MPNYLQGTTSIFTTFGLSKMEDILVGTSALKFTKIVISDKQVTLDETITLNSINVTYSFDVTDVKNNTSSRLVTVSAEIPESVQNMDIKIIGLVCTDNTNTDYLFAYANTNIKKPARGNRNKYKLTLILDFNLNIINFNSENLLFGIPEIQYATMQNYIDETAILNTDIIALEHANLNNTINIGYNKPQTYFNKEQNIKENINAFFETVDFANTYNIINKNGILTNITDAFYNITNNTYSAYKLINLAKYESNITESNYNIYRNNNYIPFNRTINTFNLNNSSYINVNNELFKGYNDNINIINKTLLIQFTLAGTVYGSSEYNTDGVILEKISDNFTIFSLQKQSSQITLSLDYNSGSGYASTNLDRFDLSNLSKNIHTLAISLDIANNPNIIMYLDGNLLEITQSFEGEYISQYYENALLTNFSKFLIPYTNNGNFIRKILCFDRILTSQEVLALSTLPEQY